MRQWIGSALGQIMACRLFGAKPLSKPVLGYCQLDRKEQTSVKFESEFYHFHARKCIWKCCLPEWRPFCSGGDELKCYSCHCKLQLWLGMKPVFTLNKISHCDEWKQKHICSFFWKPAVWVPKCFKSCSIKVKNWKGIALSIFLWHWKHGSL